MPSVRHSSENASSVSSSVSAKLASKESPKVTFADVAGADEAARGVVQVKDLILGAKIAAQASVEEWKSQPAQVEAPRGALVATVREMLAR